MAEDNEIRDKLAEHDVHVQTIAEVAPIEVCLFEIKQSLNFTDEIICLQIFDRCNRLVFSVIYIRIWEEIKSWV